MPRNACHTLLLFGATGDLSRRMLLPSLFGLDADGLLPDDLRIVATARSELDAEEFRASAAEALERYIDADRLRPEQVDRFLARLKQPSAPAGRASGARFP